MTERQTSAVGLLVVATVLDVAAVGVLVVSVGWVGSTLSRAGEVSWIVFFGTLTAFIVLRSLAAYIAGDAGIRLGTRYRRQALDVAIETTPDAVRATGPAAAMTRALDVETVGESVARTTTGVLLGIVELVAAMVVSVVLELTTLVSVLLAAAVVFVCLLVLLTHRRVRWRIARIDVTSRTTEGLLAVETAHALGETFLHQDDVQRLLQTYRQASRRLDTVAAIVAILPGLALLVALGLAWIEGAALSAALLAVWIGASLLGASGLERLASTAGEVVATVDAATALREMRAQTGSQTESAPDSVLRAGRPLSPEQQNEGVLVSAVGVTAVYPTGGGLKMPIDLTVRRGDRILLSAPSGFGKTTLGEVLSGEREPSSGDLRRADGVVVARVPQADDDHMFANSLLFNVACGLGWPPGADVREKVTSLLDELALSDLVASMPAGLAQPIGEGGWRLSSGERTRIAVASALLREPDVLVLDESIATLDGATRELVLAACVRHSRSTVLIAHWD